VLTPPSTCLFFSLLPSHEDSVSTSAFKASELQFHQDLALNGIDALVIVVRGVEILKHLLALFPFLNSSGQFCVYSQFSEPLAGCYSSLKSENAAVNLRLSETWLREHQVLPMRTHPNMQMSSKWILVNRGQSQV